MTFNRRGAVISYTDADIAERVAMLKQPSVDERLTKLEQSITQILTLLEKQNEPIRKD